MRNVANLGVATTRQLLDELTARFDVDDTIRGSGQSAEAREIREVASLLTDEQLDYRTLDI